MGECTTLTTSFKQGNNTISFRGFIRPSNLTLFSEFVSNYVNGNTTALEVRGIQIGTGNISWVQLMAKSLKTAIQVKGAENPDFIHNVETGLLNLSFVSDDILLAGAQYFLSFLFFFFLWQTLISFFLRVNTKFTLPSGFDFPFELFKITLDVVGTYLDTDFIKVIVPWSPAETNSTTVRHLDFSPH